jgi:hypothetical protein
MAVTALLLALLLFPLAGAIFTRRGVGEAYLFGAGIVGALLFMAGSLGWGLAICAAAMLLLSNRRLESRRYVALPDVALPDVALPDVAPALSRRYPILPTILLFIPLLAIAFVIIIVPLHDFDGRAFWLLKAKGIAHDRAIDGPFFRGEEVFDPRNDYPLLVPIDAALVLRAGHGRDDRDVRCFYLFLFVALALMVRERIGSLVSPAAGAWCAALLAWLPRFLVAPEGGVVSAYTDVALAAFVAGAFFELIENGSPLRFGLWLAFVLLTKNEGLPFALVLLISGAFVFRRRIGIAAMPVAVALVALLTWRHDVAAGDHEDFVALLPTLPHKLGRIWPALRGVAVHAASFSNWGGFWIAVVIAAALAWRRGALAVAVTAAMVAVYVAVYTVTSWVQADLIQSSADRLLMHFVGPALFLLATAAFQPWVRTKSI